MKFNNNRPVSAPGGSRRAAQPFRYGMTMPEPPAPPPPEPTDPSTAMVTFASDWQALAEPTHAGMYLDPAHQAEMLLMTDVLASRSDCTHVAVQDGNWTDATTWLVVATGLFGLPGPGAKIGVPAGITVTMDNNTTTAYGTLRVDGSVVYPIDQDTKLYIHTIVVNHGGVWQQGTAANPIPAAYTSIVEFTTEELDPAVDTLLLGKGFLAMGATLMNPSAGSISIWGASKDHWATTSAPITAGGTSVVLDAAPTGWAEGDELHIMSTYESGGTLNDGGDSGSWTPHRFDDVAIAAGGISGSTITFTPAATYDHAVRNETWFTDLKYYVVNFTRNIKYRSPPGTAIHRRGHFMLMGENISVGWASYDLIGRTSKFIQSWDATDSAQRIFARGSDVNWLPDSNVRGRYNFHIHRTGVDIGRDAAVVTGISCSDAPGWLIAHHQSRADFSKAVGRRFIGSGMVAETGSEAGTWDQCFIGGGLETGDPTRTDKDEYRFDVFGNDTVGKGDFGRLNNAYWFLGRAIEMTNCVAAGCERGAVWMSRATQGTAPTPAFTPEPRVFYGREQLANAVGGDAPVLRVSGNKFVCVRRAVNVIKFSPDQAMNLRTHIHSNLAWGCADFWNMEYTGHYTIENNRLLRRSAPKFSSSTAFHLGSGVADFYLSSNTARGYSKDGGGQVVDKLDNDVLFPTKDFGNIIVNNHTHDMPNLAVISLSWNNLRAPTIDDNILKIVQPGDLSTALPQWVPSSEPVWPGPSGQQTYVFLGNLTTDAGTRNRSHETSTEANTYSPFVGLSSAFGQTSLNLMLSRYGYYTYTHPTHGASSYLLVPDLISRKLPDTPGADIPVRYLTVPVRLTGVSLGDYTNQGALPTRYVDAIVATTYVVYEDIKDVGGLYEGL